MKFPSALLIASWVCLAHAQATKTEPKARAAARSPAAVVITVGPSKIQKRQIDTLVNMMVRAKRSEREPLPEERAALEKMVATNLIGQELLELEAKRLKLEVGEKEVDSIYAAYKANFPDEETFRKAMKASGETDKGLRDKLTRQIKADKLLNGQVGKVERPTLKDMQDYFAKHKTRFPVSDSLRACQILFLVGKGVKAEEAEKARTRLEATRAELMQDSADLDMLLTRFVIKAGQVSEGPEKKDGGDLQRFHPNDFFPEFKKHVTPLRVGQVSKVFRTPLGWHLVMLTERYDGKFDSYRLQVSRLVVAERSAQAGKGMKKYLQSLAAKYRVQYVEKAYQDSSPAGVYNL